MSNVIKNLILYPLNYPIEQNNKYFESPYVNLDNLKDLELIQKCHVYAETVIPTTNEIME
jgi:hypothetical protein